MMNPGLGRLFAARHSGWRSAFAAVLVKIALRLALASPSSLALFENHGDRRRWVVSRIVPRRRTSVLPGAGVDTDHFCPPSEGRPVVPFRFFFAARMLRAKGIGAFLAAARLLEADLPAAEFLVAGEIDRRDPDHYPIDALELPGNVRYLGNLPDIRDALQSAHVVCLPTAYGEGLPRILIEAAAAGCALVASDHPACRAIVRDGITGNLVPLHGGSVDPKALARILCRLSEHPDRTEAFGRNARQLILRGGFGQQVVNRRYASLILGPGRT